jgi:UPF0755 protein
VPAVNELTLSEMVGGAPQEPRRRSRRSSERRLKQRKRRTWVMMLIGLLVIGGAAGGAWVGLKPMIASFNQPTDYAGAGTGSVEVKIPDGASGTAIGQMLQDKDVVRSVKGFVAAFNDDKRSGSIQPGTYALKHQMSSAAAIAAMLDDANRLVAKVTLKEGIRAADVPALLASKTKIPLTDLQTALRSPSALGLPAEAKGIPEGWLFPATYDVQPDTTAADLLHQMVQQTLGALDAAGVPAGQRENILIKASLVQAEAKLPQDFPKVARVFDNRLLKGMRLQLDTTVHYATGRFSVATSIKDTQFKSPYNTYLVDGLPAGPIDNPGKAAIDAAQAPATGDWLYFVAVDPVRGITKYATTPGQFAAIKNEYDNWAKAHPGQ